MYPLQFLINYCIHRIGAWLDSRDHSFISDFKGYLRNLRTNHPAFSRIEQYRSEIYRNNDFLEESGLGAGSRLANKRKTIGDLARTASVSRKYGQLLFSLVDYYKPRIIVELGTAVGISTMYLAMGNPKARVITIEGNPQLAEIAAKTFSVNRLDNITFINKTFDDVIFQLIPDINRSVLIYIDGNHTREATLKYFELFGKIPVSSTILVFDDINWSIGMMQAWKSIIGSPHAGVIVDLFDMGILFQGWEKNGQIIRFNYNE